MLAAADSLVRF